MTGTRSVSVVVDRDPERPDVIWLDNGLLQLGFVPDLGGRLLSVRVAGKETLWRNPKLLDDRLHPVAGHRPAPTDGELGDWHNYGGDKTWPAPQGWSGPTEWAGPPDPVLDSGAYTWVLDPGDDIRSRSLTMTSGDDPRTGLRLSRTVVLTSGSSTYEVRLGATNTSPAPVEWALWNVTQRRADVSGTRGVLVAGPPEVLPLVTGTATPRWHAPTHDMVAVDHQRVVGKLGFPKASGWLSHISHGTTTVIEFEPETDGRYPDGGSRVEVWMETPLEVPLAHLGQLLPTDDIVELEVLGPLQRLQPGESMTLALRCTVLGEAAT